MGRKRSGAEVRISPKFDAPTSEDFDLFSRVDERIRRAAQFVYRAETLRASLWFLYPVLPRRAPLAEAERDLVAIWRPDEVWSR